MLLKLKTLQRLLAKFRKNFTQIPNSNFLITLLKFLEQLKKL